MDKDKKLRLLQAKIDQIEELIANINFDNLRQWREETLMILDNLITQDSKYYQNFEEITFSSGVLYMDQPEENDRVNAEAYVEGLRDARASLSAIKFGIENDLY